PGHRDGRVADRHRPGHGRAFAAAVDAVQHDVTADEDQVAGDARAVAVPDRGDADRVAGEADRGAGDGLVPVDVRVDPVPPAVHGDDAAADRQGATAVVDAVAAGNGNDGV